MAHFVHTAAVRAVACSSTSSLLAVAGPRGSAVRSANAALGRGPVTTPSPASRPAPVAQVRGSYVHGPRLHRPGHGRLVLDDQRMIRLARRETVPYLRQARFKCSPRCTPQDGQRVAAVTEAAVERSSRSGVVVIHTGILSPVIGAGLVLSSMGITSAKQQPQLVLRETSLYR